MSRSGDIPALESGQPDLLMGGVSIPIGMTRRALSYDDALEAPMSPPPTDININNLWRRPVIPERRFQRVPEEDESDAALTRAASFAKPTAPVVKAKASSIIMHSLMHKKTQESMHHFEKQAGLTDTGYTPHKGLTAEESRYHRMPESMHKMAVHSGEAQEDKQMSSAQSTPSSTPQTSPKQIRRGSGWFSQGSSASLTGSDLSSSSNASVDLGGAEGGGVVERWSAFGPRPFQKSAVDHSAESTSVGGFALQSYKGAQKPTPMEVMKASATRMAEGSADLQAPKMEIPSMETKRQASRVHKLKRRDMNVLTPSGF